MKASSYRDKWYVLKKEGCDAKAIERLSRQIAYSFLDHYLKDCRYEDDYIDLVEMSHEELSEILTDIKLNN